MKNDSYLYKCVVLLRMQTKAVDKRPHVIVEQFRLADEPHRSRRVLFGYSDRRSAELFYASHVKALRTLPQIVRVEDGPRIAAAADLSDRDRAEYLRANIQNSYGNGTAVFYPGEPMEA